MHNFTFFSPTKVIFGKGMVPSIVPELQQEGISRALLLTGGKSVFASGLYDAVAKLLTDAGIAFETVSGVQPNPRLSKAREAVDAAKKMNAQAILPVGGGSVFDSAKAIAAAVSSNADVWDIMSKKQDITDALPIYGILTLSGTSSEINNTGVLSNEETRDKVALANPLLFPKVSIVDPSLQYTVPLRQVRYGAFDTFSHALEAYFCNAAAPLIITEHTESYCRRIITCLAALPEKLNDYDTRAELSFCATYVHSGWCGIGRRVRGDFASHRIGHALGALFDIPHAVTLSVIMPNWLEYCLERGLLRNELARFAAQVLGAEETSGKDMAKAGIEAFKEFIRSLDMPTRMRDAGIEEKDIPALAEKAADTLPFGAAIPMNLEHITGVLRKSF